MIRRVVALILLLSPTAFAADDPVAPPPIRDAPVEKSRILYVMDSNSLRNGFEPNEAVIGRMVDALILAATGKGTRGEAWRTLVSPSDVVGIKVASAMGPMGGTRVAVVRAIARGLREAGLPRERILVWDRNEDDLLAAGFANDAADYTLRWIDPATGYDRNALLTAPVLGRLIWGDSRFGQREGTRLEDRLSMGDQLSSTSYYASVLSKEVTKVINVPSLSDSFLTGINGAIANMTLWNVDNWRRFTRPPNFGDPFLAEIYADPMVKDKVVLTILDALALQFAGGPMPNPNFVRQNFALFASKDPVAIDATALRLLEEYRLAYKLPPLSKTSGHILSAEAMGLGKSDESEIQTIRVGMEGIR